MHEIVQDLTYKLTHKQSEEQKACRFKISSSLKIGSLGTLANVSTYQCDIGPTSTRMLSFKSLLRIIRAVDNGK